MAEIAEPKLNTNSNNEFVNDEMLDNMRELCRESLFFLARAVLGFGDFTDHIHLPVCERLQNANIRRKIIVMPRTWYKSSSVIAFCIWSAINDPNVRILIIQNTFSNATKKLASIRQIFEKNELFRALFPELLPTANSKWSSDILEVSRTATHPEGTFEAAGTGTAVTSRHYDIIIEDDTVSPEKDDMSVEMQQPTAAEIEKAIGMHKLCTPLLVNQKKGQIIVVGTRWCEEDLIGWIMSNFDSYEIITRAVRESKEGVPATKEEGGVPAWPEMFDEEVLDEYERALGPYMFATLMMNMPTSASNQTFRRDWVKYFDSVDYTRLVCCTSIDPAAMGEQGDPDYDVVITTGVDVDYGRVYVLDYVRERMNPGRLIEVLLQHYEMYRPVQVLVEGVAYQRTFKYWAEQVQKQRRIFFPINELPKGFTGRAKNDVIKGLQPFFSNLMIFMRNHMDVLERELLAFPAPRGHDDVINALAFQVRFWNDTLTVARSNKEKVRANDPLSFDCILRDLKNRTSPRLGFPYDMGWMKDRLGSSRARALEN